jgi:hypothetical protein
LTLQAWVAVAQVPPTFLLNPARRIAHFGKKPPKVPAEVTSPLIYSENLFDLTIYGYIITLWLMGETYEFYVSNPHGVVFSSAMCVRSS